MEWSTWFGFVLATVVVLVIPGPSVLFVVNIAAPQGIKSVFAASLGIVLGDFMVLTCSLLGLGAIILASPFLFRLIRWLGAVYFFYLGYYFIVSAMPKMHIVINKKIYFFSFKTIFHKAFFVTALNPQAIIFFISFVPQFILPSQSILLQSVILSVTFLLLAYVNIWCYGLFVCWADRKLVRWSWKGVFAYCSGGVLMMLGILMIVYQDAF